MLVRSVPHHIGKLSQRVARAFDVVDGRWPFLHYKKGQADDPISRTELAAFALATRQALIEVALALERIDPHVEDDPRAPYL